MAKLYGWFSQNSKNQGNGSSIYEHVDGTHVEITVVCKSNTDAGTSWDDIVCIGEVKQWIKKCDGGNFGALFSIPFTLPKNSPTPQPLTPANIKRLGKVLDKIREEASIPKVDTGPMYCTGCKEQYPYAEPNQADGTLICYSCRH